MTGGFNLRKGQSLTENGALAGTTEQMFHGIKRMCALSSEQLARQYARIMKKDFFDWESEKTQRAFVQLRKRAEKMARRHRIHMYHEPTKSRVRNLNGGWINIMGFAQYFSREAPLLSEFLNELGAMVEIDPESGKIKFFGIGVRSPSDFFAAEYFISSEEIYALNLASGEIFQFKGRQISAITRGTAGKPVISLNLEREPSMGDLIYEVVRAQWPEYLSEQKISHDLIDPIRVNAEKQLNLSGKAPIVEVDPLRGERSQISDRFKPLDEALMGCLHDILR